MIFINSESWTVFWANNDLIECFKDQQKHGFEYLYQTSSCSIFHSLTHAVSLKNPKNYTILTFACDDHHQNPTYKNSDDHPKPFFVFVNAGFFCAVSWCCSDCFSCCSPCQDNKIAIHGAFILFMSWYSISLITIQFNYISVK